MERLQQRSRGLMTLACLLAVCLSPLGAAAEQNRGLLDDAKAPQPAPAPVEQKRSNIVASAGEVVLTNGVGDVLPTGACKADVAAFCKDVTAGEGRLAACLNKRVKEAKKGNVAGRKVSDKCIEDIAKYKIDRSTNINKDVALARACKDDVAKFCKDKSDASKPGSVVACLRDVRDKLSSGCKSEVFRTMLEAAEDYRFDVQLYGACKDDVASVCKDVEAGDGSELECLAKASQSIRWECREQVIRVRKEGSDDIRLNTKLFRACLLDKKKFCKDVEPGHMRVQDCLEDNMDEAGFSTQCKKELENVIAARVADFKLDGPMRSACEEDLQSLCRTSLSDMDGDAQKKTSGLKCLQDFREDIKSTACKEKVHRAMTRAARDIRFDDVLANACADDRKAYCAEVQPGSARVIRCLQDHRATLQKGCAAALFDHEVKMAEDIDFKYPMRKACAWEVSAFCKDVPHGHARIVRCLQKNTDHTDMSRECREEVTKDMNRMAQDYRLNWRLNHACEAETKKLCDGVCNVGNGQPCGGLVLQCLREKQDNITSASCQEELFYFELMEVTDFRNDVILAEACREDVEKHCKDVTPGEGRVHHCLRINRNLISERCRAEEMKLQAIEFRDVRLRPKLNKVCSEEKAVYCKDVKPGKARVIKCLMEAMAQPNFGEECKAELQKREDAVKNDYRYDVGVFQACGADVDRICAEAKTKLRGNATVLKCLAENYKDTADACQSEMSRAVRFALWDYKPSAPLTAVCDADVENFCPKGARTRPGGVFTIGAIGRCLSKALVEGRRLAPKCRELVLIAAPKDSRVYLQYPESTSALVAKIAELQRGVGLDQVLVDPYARSGSGVTVTGWAALACMISLVVVSIGGAVLLVRRLTGVDKPHTQWVKDGST